jgi:hypothetical protein
VAREAAHVSRARAKINALRVATTTKVLRTVVYDGVEYDVVFDGVVRSDEQAR